MYNNEIVPGCMCIVIRGPETGRVITAIRYMGHEVEDCPEKDIWEVDQELVWHAREEGEEIKLYYCPQDAMMRIDDDEPEEEITETETNGEELEYTN